MSNETTQPSPNPYHEREIPAWIDAPERGGRFRFDRIAHRDADGSVPLSQLRADEFVTYPGLIYRRIA